MWYRVTVTWSVQRNGIFFLSFSEGHCKFKKMIPATWILTCPNIADWCILLHMYKCNNQRWMQCFSSLLFSFGLSILLTRDLLYDNAHTQPCFTVLYLVQPLQNPCNYFSPNAVVFVLWNCVHFIDNLAYALRPVGLVKMIKFTLQFL